MSNNVISMRDKLRSKALEAQGKFKCEMLECEGEQFMIRQPSVMQRAEILKRSGVKGNDGKNVELNFAEMQVWSTIYCTYTPEGERVFDEHDAPMLRDTPAGGFVDSIAKVALDLMNGEAEEVSKN